jgi:hypothetical protein
VITLSSGQKFMVQESAQEVVDRIVMFRRSINAVPAVSLPRLEPGPQDQFQEDGSNSDG